MNNTQTRERPALYCGTYAKYNNGSIAGKWLQLDDYADKDEFLKACAELHSDESDPEFMFQDFECFPEAFYNESFVSDELFEWVNLDQDDKELVTEFADATGYSLGDYDIDLEAIQDKHFCTLDFTWSSDEDSAMGEYLIDEGLIEVPEHIQGYIDTEKLGRDYLMDMSVSSNGFVFTNY